MANQKFELRDVAGQPNKKELVVGNNRDFTVRGSYVCDKEELKQLYIYLRELFKDDE